MPLTLAELALIKRDLSDTLNTVITAQPRFISLFKSGVRALNIKHEWGEDQIGPRAITATAATSGGVLTVSADDAGKIKAGTLVSLKNDVALFKVTAISGTSVTVDMVASNGSSLTDETLPTAGGIFNIVATPTKIGSANGDGEEEYRFNGTNHNFTQIFRKEIIIPRTISQLQTYGDLDNNLNRQTAFALMRMTQDMNRAAIMGRRVQATDSVKGEMGGLYAFATGTGELSVNANGATLDSYLINDGAQSITGSGGNATQILCGPGQARVISNENKNRFTIMRGDEKTGAYVAEVVNEANGTVLTVISDPDIVDTHAWILDPEGFFLAPYKALTDEDATEKGFDGIKRLALGEMTLEFRNAKQRCCLIKGLKPSATAIGEFKDGAGKVFVGNSESNPVPTNETRTVTVNADASVPAASAANYGYRVLIGTAWTSGTKIATAVKGEIWASNGSAWVKQ